MSLASQLSFLESSTSTIQQTNNNIIIAGGGLSVSTTTGALQIANGGLGVGGGAVFGGTVTATNFVGAFSGTITGTASTATNLGSGTAGQIAYQTAPGLTGFAGPGSYGQFLMSTGASAPVYQSTLTQVNGNIIITSNTGASSTITGALQVVNGGVGIGGAIYAGDFIQVYSGNNTYKLRLQSSGAGLRQLNLGVDDFTSKTFIDTTFSTTGAYPLQIRSGGTSIAEFSSTQLVLPTTTSVSSTNTGALQVAGGIGVAGGGFFGGVVTATTYYGTFNGTIGVGTTITTATNIAAGTAGQLHYQSAPGITAFINTATTGYFLQANYVGAPTWTGTASIYVNRATIADTATTATNAGTAYATIGILSTGTGFYGGSFNGSAAQTWSLNTGTLMNTAVNITGGANGSLLYQTGAGATTALAIGTNGYVLTSNGTIPGWAAVSGLTAGNATNAANVATIAQTGNATYYPVFVNANNATSANMALYTSSTFSINPATGQHNIGGSLYVAGDLFVDGQNFIVNTNTISSGDKALVLSTGSASAALASGAGLYVGATSSTAYTSLYYDGANGWIAGGSTGGSLMLGGATTPANGAKLTVTGGANFTTIVTATTFVGALTGTATSANNLTGGAAGSLPYQTGAGATTMLALGTSGYVLTAGGSAPQWTALSGVTSGNATTATNIANGTAGQLVYQSAPGTTAFVNTATTGYFLQANYVGAPTWTGTASIYVNRATLSDTSTNAATAYSTIASHSAGTGLTGSAFNGSAAQTWTLNTATLMQTSVNVVGGAAGSLVYQTGAGATTTLALGTNGYVLTAGASAPAWTALSGVTSGNATNAANIATVAQTGNATYYATFVNANNASSANMAVYTTSTFTINPATGAVGVNGVGGTALNINVTTANADKYFLTCTGAVNSFSIYENSNTAYLNSYNNMSLRVNQNGGTGGNLLISGGNVLIGSGTPGAPLSFTDATGLKIQLNANAANYYAIEKQAAVNSGDGLFKYNAGQTSAGEHGFYSGGSLKFLIDANGKVGINRTAPAARLHLVGVGSATSEIVARFAKGNYADTGGHTCLIALNNEPATWSKGAIGWTRTGAYDTGYFGIYVNGTADTSDVNTATDARLLASTSGIQIANALGVGTAASGTTGEIRATNEITAYYSDRRLKENVVVIDNAVEKVLSLHGITYTPNDVAASFGYDKTVKLVGLFADEVEAVLPEATRPAPFDQDENGNSKSGENYKTIQYEKVVPLLVEAIKEQQATIKTLLSELEDIKKQLGK